MKIKKAICLISGGLDSAVSVGVAKELGCDLYFLFISYGQKTLVKEEQCVDQLAKFFKPKKIWKVSLPWLKEFGGSALFDKKTVLNENNFLLEYVPFRNSIFLSIATALAEAIGADYIFLGSSGGDHICPDNSPEYLNSFQRIIEIGTLLKKDIKIKAPFSKTNKVGIVNIGKKLNVPFKNTWSCHNNINKACGHCSNCLARLDAFEVNGLKDPIDYEEN